MSENSDIGDLTLKQLLQLYKAPESSREERELKGQRPANNQEDVDKFSSIASDKSVNIPDEKKIEQNLAHIVDALIKKIGS